MREVHKQSLEVCFGMSMRLNKSKNPNLSTSFLCHMCPFILFSICLIIQFLKSIFPTRCRSFLAQHLRHPRQHATHTSMSPILVFHLRHPHQQYTYATHASVLSTSAHRPHHTQQHVTHTSTLLTPPTLACMARQHLTHATHASTHSTPFLKLPNHKVAAINFISMKNRQKRKRKFKKEAQILPFQKFKE